MGMPLDLGKRHVLASLTVPWAYYHSSRTTSDMPRLAFSAKNIGDLAFPRRLGHELTVQDFSVDVTSRSQNTPGVRVAVAAVVHYQPSKGTQWGNKEGAPPPASQELALEGAIVQDDASTLKLMVTSKGAAKHVWENAFGEPTVALEKAAMLVRMSSHQMRDIVHHGVDYVHV